MGLLLAGMAGCAPRPAPWCALPPIAPRESPTLVFGWLVPPAPYPPWMLQPPRPPVSRLPDPPAPPKSGLCFVRPTRVKMLFGDPVIAGLRACSPVQHRDAPRAKGHVRLRLDVAPSGAVTSVAVDPSIPLPASVLGCFTKAALSRAPFAMELSGDVPSSARAQATIDWDVGPADERPPSGPVSMGSAQPFLALTCWSAP